MKRRASLKRSQHHLKHLIEGIVSEQHDLSARGLAFLVDELSSFGSRPERFKVWATLHFLRLGSPFCCAEPGCHLFLFGERLERVNESLRLQMSLIQRISVEFVAIASVVHDGVEFDEIFTGRRPMPNQHDIDKRDALGRTALMRAATRGHNTLVEELLEAGADPAIRDNHGRSILEQVQKKGNTWITRLIEDAVGPRK